MLIAAIREEDCIGCAKCLPACPVDAIIGASKFLHTVITDECIGCQLCVAPCPMNCIEMIESPTFPISQEGEASNIKVARANKAKQRYLARRQREIKKKKPQLIDANSNPELKEKIREEIQLAIARVKAKKNEQQKNSRDI
jgi:electron transport complex protein RnfB